jgi:hypothetical protein
MVPLTEQLNSQTQHLDRATSFQPCFIYSSDRSGSTHLELMLDSHPDIACAGDINSMLDLGSDDGKLPNLEQVNSFHLELINNFLQQKGDRKPLVCTTSNLHFEHLLKLWPEARFIHMVRDGRDVAYSCMSEMGQSSNAWNAVERWMEAEELWAEVDRVVPAERKLEISYEQLVTKPVYTLTKICHFLGIAYTNAMLESHLDTPYELPNHKYIGLWQHKLSAKQIRLAEARIGTTLVERGYKLSGLPSLNWELTSQVSSRTKIKFIVKTYELR